MREVLQTPRPVCEESGTQRSQGVCPRNHSRAKGYQPQSPPLCPGKCAESMWLPCFRWRPGKVSVQTWAGLPAVPGGDSNSSVASTGCPQACRPQSRQLRQAPSPWPDGVGEGEPSGEGRKHSDAGKADSIHLTTRQSRQLPRAPRAGLYMPGRPLSCPSSLTAPCEGGIRTPCYSKEPGLREVQ